VQPETTRTRIRRSCGLSWDRSAIAAVPPSQQLLGPSFMDGRHPGDPVRWPVLHFAVAYFGQHPKRLGSRQNIFACPLS
jgi:hypothetical protein